MPYVNLGSYPRRSVGKHVQFFIDANKPGQPEWIKAERQDDETYLITRAPVPLDPDSVIED